MVHEELFMQVFQLVQISKQKYLLHLPCLQKELFIQIAENCEVHLH